MFKNCFLKIIVVSNSKQEVCYGFTSKERVNKTKIRRQALLVAEIVVEAAIMGRSWHSHSNQ